MSHVLEAAGPTGDRRATFAAATALGAAAGLAAWAAPDAVLVGTLVVVAAAAGALATHRRPAWVAAGLLGLVTAQDALVAAGLGPAQQADELLVLALVAGAVWRAPRRPGIPWAPALLAFALVAAAGALARGVPPLVAALGLLALVKGPLAGTAAARLPLTPAGVRRVADGAAGLVALAGAVAVAQRLGGAVAFERTGQAAHFARWAGAKAPGLFAHHNALAHAAVLAGAWWLGRRAAGLPAGLAVRAAEAATLAGLVASASREGWLAALVGLAALARAARPAAQARRTAAGGADGPRRRRFGRALSGLGAALVAAGAASYGLSPVLRAELGRRLAGVPAGWHDFELGLTDAPFRGEYRVYALRASAAVWADHPWLGAGVGRYGGAVAERFESPVYAAIGFLGLDGRYAPLDLFWARLPAELGLLGAAAFVCLLAAGWRAAAGTRTAADPVVRALGLGAAAAWPAAWVVAAFAPSFEDPLVVVPLWLWTGAAWRLAGAAADPGPDRAGGAQ